MNQSLRCCMFSLLLGLAWSAQAVGFAQRSEVRNFIAEMHAKHGFSKRRLAEEFARIRPLPGVIKAVQPPHDNAARSWQGYLGNHVDAQRILLGQRFWHEHAARLRAAQQQTGVPEEIIVAIIGIESIYGHHMGKFNTLAALATLTFNYPDHGQPNAAQRKALFRRELEEFLLLARSLQRPPSSFRGSYAGALGMPQFLPSSIRQYAVDGNQDGAIDLSRNPDDAIASVANFLWQHGWEDGAPITAPATVSGERIDELLAQGILPRLRPAELIEYGVKSPNAPDLPAALIDLATPQQATTYHLGFQNFFVITRYNRSSFYAMAVTELGRALKSARKQAQDNRQATSETTLGSAPLPEPPAAQTISP